MLYLIQASKIVSRIFLFNYFGVQIFSNYHSTIQNAFPLLSISRFDKILPLGLITFFVFSFILFFSESPSFGQGMAQPGGQTVEVGQVSDAYASGYQFGLGSQSTYSNGSNAKQLTGSPFGPYTLGERAEYGVFDFRINTEGGYDDNIYLAPSGTQGGPGVSKQGDWYYVVTPGAAYRLGSFASNAIELGCDSNLIQFTRYSESSFQQTLPYFRSHFLTGKTTITLNNSVTLITGGADTAKSNELTLRTPQTSNTANLGVDFDFSDKTAFSADYLNYIFSPTTASGFDGSAPLLPYIQNEGSLQADWKAFAKLSFYVRGTVGNFDVGPSTGGPYQPQVSSMYYEGFVGAHGEFTPFLTGNARVGGLAYDSGVSGVSNTYTYVLFLDMTYQPTDDLKIVLSGTRQQLPSFIYSSSSSYTLSQGNLAIGWQFGPLLENAPEDPDGMGATKQLRRFTFGPSLSFANTQYDSLQNSATNQTVYDSTSAPTNDLITATLGLEYRIQPYWTVYGNYSYQRNISTIPANTYFDNRFAIGAAFKF